MNKVQKGLLDAATTSLQIHERITSEIDADIERRYKTKDFHFTPAQKDELTRMMLESDSQMLKVINLGRAYLKEH